MSTIGNNRQRRGVTSVMAMLYLVLFSTLAVGFYAAVTTSVQISANEQRAVEARLASESGLEFMKHVMATLNVPPGTPEDELWAAAFDRLTAKFDAMNVSDPAQKVVGLSADGETITIPEDPNVWFHLDADGRSRFKARITKKTMPDGLKNAGVLEVFVQGRSGTLASTKGVQLEFDNAPNQARIFDFGVATPGKVEMNGNTKIMGAAGQSQMGSVLTTYTGTGPSDYALVMVDYAEMSGMAYFTNPNAALSISVNSKIQGLSPTDPGFADVIEKGVDAPEFPVVDTSAFKAYATTPYDSKTMAKDAILTNVYIPANTNPTITGGTINGVLYIYQPNSVKFSGTTKVNGSVVVDNTKVKTEDDNVLTFNSVVVGTMPDSMPAGLKDLGGSFLLADNFTANFGGNFGVVNGAIVASAVNFAGTAGGTIKGSVIALGSDPVSIKGTTSLTIESQGADNRPAGLKFGTHYEPIPDTYAEVSSAAAE